MNRFIVFNAECGWIQGDIVAHSPAEAVARMEGRMSTETENADWHVFKAPASFPASASSYSAVDAALVSTLRASTPIAIVPNNRFAAPLPSMALAS
ncbi:hypothetical protein BSY19_5216 (plasmid) [Bosea sp. RAC05]|nr:hypothetical protein BSY19_5216 [Bosea sp. RAC05]